MEPHLKVVGTLLILLSGIHVGFPKYFKWKNDLHGVSLINRQMMYVHTFFIGLGVLMIGCLCLAYSHDLVETRLGRTIAIGLAIFWGIRLIVQFIGYSSILWRRKRFETVIHIAFLFLWSYFTLVFLLTGIRF